MRAIPKNAAQRRYLYRFIPTMSLYVVLIFFASYEFRRGGLVGWAAYAIAVLPALPILAMLVVVGMYLTEEPDEFERTVVVQSMLWAMGGTLAVTTVWGLLEMYAKVPHMWTFWTFPMFWMLVGVATPLVRWRYR